MRCLKEAIAELHAADPDCRFTLYALRVAVRSGKVVSMDSLYAYLAGDKSADSPYRFSFERGR